MPATARSSEAAPTGTARSSRRVRLPKIGWEAYVHLVWLSFLAFQPIFDPGATARDWVLVGVLIAAFLPVYVWTWSRQGTAAVPGVAAIALLGLASSPWNSGAAAFLIYAAAIAGYKLEPRPAAALIAALTLAVALAALLSSVPWPYALLAYAAPFLAVPLIGAMNVVYGVRARTTRALRQANEEIERLAAIAERERIARDLHDLLGHTLSVIVLKSEVASRLSATDPDRAADEIRDVERVSRRALAEVREAVGGYRRRGLSAEIDNARSAFDAAGVRLEAELPPDTPPARVEGTLAMVLREAVTNVLRHAGAQRCSVRLTRDGEAWVLEVTDDGHGQLGPPGMGLAGLRERVEALGGTLEVAGGNGARLVARLPGRVTV